MSYKDIETTNGIIDLKDNPTIGETNGNSYNRQQNSKKSLGWI